MKFRKLLIISMAVVALCGCGRDNTKNNSSDTSGAGISIAEGVPDDGVVWGELVPVE